MKNEEIVKWLRSKNVETGSLLCLGCGHEHNCGLHGCAAMRAAADAMENLQTENAALRRHIETLTSAQVVMVKEFTEKMEELERVKAERSWISVKDRLPEDKQRVLVRCKTVGTTAGWRLWGEWMTDLGDGGSEVAYWMPLPEPPEEALAQKGGEGE
ncbi:MAG: DUF551 domain-containing protein [Dysosmobacter sp.]|nr:DUF551 domain-containing protein [Dysosmobacter sp.]